MDETKIICEEYVNALHSGGDRRRKRLCSTTRLMLAHVERIEKKMEERLNDCFFSNENNDVACAFEACIKRLLADQRINWGRIVAVFAYANKLLLREHNLNVTEVTQTLIKSLNYQPCFEYIAKKGWKDFEKTLALGGDVTPEEQIRFMLVSLTFDIFYGVFFCLM